MFRTTIMIAVLTSWVAAARAQQEYDIVVYGGTAGGVTAAVQTVRMGKTVLLIAERTARPQAAINKESGHHLGSDDVLGVYVEGVLGLSEQQPPERIPDAPQDKSSRSSPLFGYPRAISQEGTIPLPMLDKPIRVVGMTLAQAEAEILNEYVRAKILLERARVFLTLETGLHIGGLTSGGLGATDIGNKAAIGGLSRNFYERIAEYYEEEEARKHKTRVLGGPERARDERDREESKWTFEPHAAEIILRTMLAEEKVPVVFGTRLVRHAGVRKDGPRIRSIVMEDGQTFHGKMFIDATYEGDLMAGAGCSHTVGREANSQYDETLNGVQLGSKSHQFKKPVDPYVEPGKPASGLLPGIHAGPPGEHGAGDKRVQAYNFRMCMTDDSENRLPWPKPAGYDPLRYELLLRYLQAGVFDALNLSTPMPNRKTDTNNNGAFSTDNIGMNYDYADGDYATRERIWNDHIIYQQGLMYFLANDPRVPEAAQAHARKWGPAKDEFVDTGNWPHQLYVREARRMVSDYVMTEHNCRGRDLAPDSVGLGAYGMDSHNVQRYVKDGYAINEGDVQVHGFVPYPIAYRAIVPKASECANLFVPVCLSATHIAYGSIRMEPVFMVLGQSAATAACQAIDEQVAVQQIDTAKLRARLLADKQVLEWTRSKNTLKNTLRMPNSLPGIVMDDTSAKLTGEWGTTSIAPSFVGYHYLHDGREKDVLKEARFEIPVPTAGRYEVRISYSPLANRATNVPVTVHSSDNDQAVTVNQRERPPIDGLFQSLGVYRFTPERPAIVIISNRGADGYVIVDAVQLLPAP